MVPPAASALLPCDCSYVYLLFGIGNLYEVVPGPALLAPHENQSSRPDVKTLFYGLKVQL